MCSLGLISGFPIFFSWFTATTMEWCLNLRIKSYNILRKYYIMMVTFYLFSHSAATPWCVDVSKSLILVNKSINLWLGLLDWEELLFSGKISIKLWLSLIKLNTSLSNKYWNAWIWQYLNLFYKLSYYLCVNLWTISEEQKRTFFVATIE